MGRRVPRRVLSRGSEKGLSRRHLEGRSRPFREYDFVGVCPKSWPVSNVLIVPLSSSSDKSEGEKKSSQELSHLTAGMVQ